MKQLSEKETRCRVLDSKVIAVASATKAVGDWSAYIGAVPGRNHQEEWEKVAEEGSKLPYEVARVLFPSFDRAYTWRP